MDFKKSIVVYYVIGIISLVVAHVSLSMYGVIRWENPIETKTPILTVFVIASVVTYLMFLVAGTATLLYISKNK